MKYFKVKEKSILFIHDYDPMGIGGLVLNTRQIARKFAMDGYTVTICSLRAEDSEELAENIDIARIDDMSSLEKLITDSRAVVVNVNYSVHPTAVAALKYCNEVGKAYFTWIRTTKKTLKFNTLKDEPKLVRDVAMLDLKTFLDNPLCIKAIVVSRAVRDDLVSIGVRENKIKIVNDGIKGKEGEIDHIEKTRDIVFVGSLFKEKNPALFVDLVNRIKHGYGKDIKASIVGSGPLYDEIKKQIMSNDLNRNIKMYGDVRNGTARDVISKHKILCSTSLTESFGIAVVEAMMEKALVIAPDIEGPREILNKGSYGILYEAGNLSDLARKCNSSLDNFSKLKPMITAAYLRAVDRYSLDYQYTSLRQIIGKLNGNKVLSKSLISAFENK